MAGISVTSGVYSNYNLLLVVAHVSQLLLTFASEVRPVYFGKEALDPSFVLISALQ